MDATKKKAAEKRKAESELRKVANLIGAELKKAALAMEKAALATAASELRKEVEANMLELRKVSAAMAAAMASGADDRTAAVMASDAVDVDLSD